MGMRKLGDIIILDFVLHNPATGFVQDADSLPTCEVFDGENDIAILSPTVTKRTGKTGDYRVPIEATVGNGFEVGKSYNVIVSVTVSGIDAKGRIGSFTLDSKRNADLQDLAQSQILSDAIPIQGARIDAAITSRPTLIEIEATTILAKDATVAKDVTVAKENTLNTKASQESVDSKPTLADILVEKDQFKADVSGLAKEDSLEPLAKTIELEPLAKDATVAKDNTVAKESSLTPLAKEETVLTRTAPSDLEPLAKEESLVPLAKEDSLSPLAKEATLISKASQSSVDTIKSEEDAIKANTDTIPAIKTETDKISSIKAKTNNLPIDPASETGNILFAQQELIRILKTQEGRWKIENNELIIYDIDNITIYKKFRLLDKNGNPAMINIYERVPE